ncbi:MULTISPECIES: formylmethanofuran dehydrogenase subunit C [Variovorax]|uniref:Formylmethanofuran dehydrogenase subunit C n=1 Tax=Variovorax paradoxus TaxID=34073 RepID=A0AAE3Y2Z1_VARPD|nr:MULTISPECIES: formylmethanofuran dehydrogenase subunit C [Variovorax]MBD9664073.1 formylmethanofuran dehydrogenase subunit C [Variovorax sp. VRV01]MDP9964949.1 formylmethanofuran dehydrogenase subunit C [Variovorax paradoxus]MDR6428550.1 formylmethanofuran dehydrogenase subunit C [Variovorax paradoxus]MDR6455204.1 formylmethanofuran dehydrogenase subunit C [Variovorax paradoxus]
MSGWHFRLRQVPALRVDLRGVTPTALAELSAAQIGQLPVGHGNAMLPLAELFDVAKGTEEGTLRFEGVLERFDRIGWQMDGGRIHVEGHAGHYAGGCMRGGSLQIDGSAGLLAACEMAGGSIEVKGDVGDFAASTLPGSMDGMRGGTFVVHGHAGERFGDRMRRGSALVHGDAGAFLGSRMVAGTIAVGGKAGAHAGYGMRRGSIVFAGPDAALPQGIEAALTFVPNRTATPVFWALLSRDLARHGGAFAALPTRRIERHLGDLSADGKGELIVCL